MKGWVYIISNRAMPSYIKVGFSTKDPAERAAELGTGAPFGYEVEYDVLVDDPKSIEKAVHETMAFLSAGKEWFECDVSIALRAIRKSCEGRKVYYETYKNTEPPVTLDTNARAVDTNDALMHVRNEDVAETGLALTVVHHTSSPVDTLQKSFDLLRSKADAGDAEAQFELGRRLDVGDGTRKNLKESFRWYKAAADQGHIDSCLAVARAYRKGRGVEKQYPEDDEELPSLSYLRKAANAGSAEGMYYLANDLCWGMSDADYNALNETHEVVRFWEKASELGFPEAMYSQGFGYQIGSYGYVVDKEKAFMLVSSVAEKGYPPALRTLGDYYYLGFGCTKDRSKAKHLWELAVAQKDQTAKKRLDGSRLPYDEELDGEPLGHDGA